MVVQLLLPAFLGAYHLQPNTAPAEDDPLGIRGCVLADQEQLDAFERYRRFAHDCRTFHVYAASLGASRLDEEHFLLQRLHIGNGAARHSRSLGVGVRSAA